MEPSRDRLSLASGSSTNIPGRNRVGDLGNMTVMTRHDSSSATARPVASAAPKLNSTWAENIWAPRAIGSGLRNGTESSRPSTRPMPLHAANDGCNGDISPTDDGSEAITGSGSLLDTSTSEHQPRTRQNWPSMGTISAPITASRGLDTGTSPLKMRGESSARSTSPFSGPPSTTVVHSAASAGQASQAFADSALRSFDYRSLPQTSTSMLHPDFSPTDDDAHHRRVASINFGSLSAQSQSAFPNFAASQLPRNGSRPASQPAIDLPTTDSRDRTSFSGPFTHRPNQASRASVVSNTSTGRTGPTGNWQSPQELATFLSRMDVGRASWQQPPSESSWEHLSMQDAPSASSAMATASVSAPQSGLDPNVLRAASLSFEPGTTLAALQTAHRLSGPARMVPSTAHSDASASTHTACNRSGVLANSNLETHGRSLSNASLSNTGARPSNNLAEHEAWVDSKLRGLQQQQQATTTNQQQQLPLPYNHQQYQQQQQQQPLTYQQQQRLPRHAHQTSAYMANASTMPFRPPFGEPYAIDPQVQRMNVQLQYYQNMQANYDAAAAAAAAGGPMSLMSHHASPQPPPYNNYRMPPRGPARDMHAPEPKRSPLLEDYKLTRQNKNWHLKDIYTHVVEFAGDQHGSRFIQSKLEVANSDEKAQLFAEIYPNALQLMTDVFGNYVIQKFFEHGNQVQKKQLADRMRGHMPDLAVQMYGCRVVQKAFEHILTDQQAVLVRELEHIVMKCVKDQNGNHVIQKAIQYIPTVHIPFIINAFTGQVHQLASHPYGCRVIQRMLEHCPPHVKQNILRELHFCAQSLIIDQFGNYVIQHVLESGPPEDRSMIHNVLLENVVNYSKHKFASNVVERAIENGTPEQRRRILHQLCARLDRPETSLQALMRDSYGNYVLQKLLKFLDGSDRLHLISLCRPALVDARLSVHGRQVDELDRLINGGGVAGLGNLSLTTQTMPQYSREASTTQSPVSEGTTLMATGHTTPLLGRQISTHPSQRQYPPPPPLDLDAASVTASTPPLVNEDAHSPQSSSQPSTTNGSLNEGSLGGRHLDDDGTLANVKGFPSVHVAEVRADA